MAFKTIKTKADLIDWAKRVNLCANRNGICDLQDEFGRSKHDDLHAAFCALEDWSEAELPMFAISKAMSHQTYMTYLNIHCNKVADRAFQKMKEEYQKELDQEQSKIRQEAEQLNSLRKHFEGLEKTIQDLSGELTALTKTNASLTEENQRHAHALLELTDELSVHRTFKNTLREYVAA